MSPRHLFDIEPAPARRTAPAARHLAIEDYVYHAGADSMGVLVALGLRRSRVKFGAHGPVYVYDTQNLRHATEAEIRRFGYEPRRKRG